jgi:uncharacterized protein (DUF952 family)
MSLIYKILPRSDWDEAAACGQFGGSPVDLEDGYIHFSTRSQAQETAARHFRGQAGLVVVAVEAEALGAALRWEPSRGGQLFPHLYAPLDTTLAQRVADAPLDADGVPDLGALAEEDRA